MGTRWRPLRGPSAGKSLSWPGSGLPRTAGATLTTVLTLWPSYGEAARPRSNTFPTPGPCDREGNRPGPLGRRAGGPNHGDWAGRRPDVADLFPGPRRAGTPVTPVTSVTRKPSMSGVYYVGVNPCRSVPWPTGGLLAAPPWASKLYETSHRM